MRRSWLLGMLLLAGCAVVPAPALAPVPAAAASATPLQLAGVMIDPRLHRLYGAAGEVVWALNPGRRPTITVLDGHPAVFAPGTDPARVEAFASAVGGTVVWRAVAPATPDGKPARETDTWQLALAPSAGDLADLPALAAAAGVRRPDLASSEDALRRYHAYLRARTRMAEFGVQHLGLNVKLCVPEDCGVDPADPYAQAAPEPVGLGMAADGRGWLFKLGEDVWLEDPQGLRTPVFVADGRTMALAVDPRLRFMIVAELAATADAGPRIMYRPLEPGAARELVPPTVGLDLGVALSPDGRWLALPTGAGLRRLDLDDLAATPMAWHTGVPPRQMAWSPDSRRLAFGGGPPEAVWLLDRDAPAPRAVATREGLTWLGWLADGRLVMTFAGNGKYDGRLAGAIADPAGGEPVAFDWPYPAGSTHLLPRALAPDGQRLLLHVIPPGKPEQAFATLDLASGRYADLPAGSRAPRWRPDGKLACEGEAVGQPVACEALP